MKKIKIDANYHTHIYMCHHAEGTINDYVERAIELEYQYIGISDHGPIPSALRTDFYTRRMEEDEFWEIYLNDLNIAKLRYKDRIKVLGAVEIEYFDNIDEVYQTWLKELDYLMLGQHFIRDQSGRHIDVYHNMTDELIEIYVKDIEKGLDTGYFKILAHPEIFMFSYHQWNEKCVEWARRIILAANRNDVYLELNANGFRRRPLAEFTNEVVYPYPRKEFWQVVAKEFSETKVVIGDDSHQLNCLHDNATINAYELAESLGLNIKTRLDL